MTITCETSFLVKSECFIHRFNIGPLESKTKKSWLHVCLVCFMVSGFRILPTKTLVSKICLTWTSKRSRLPQNRKFCAGVMMALFRANNTNSNNNNNSSNNNKCKYKYKYIYANRNANTHAKTTTTGFCPGASPALRSTSITHT